jgi:hypothetical protein
MTIHGTSSPSDRGNAVSHGCVRVYNEDLKSLLDVPLGTPVEITTQSSPLFRLAALRWRGTPETTEADMASVNPPANVIRTAWSWVARIDRVVIPFLRRIAVLVLRISLGVVFVWFGLLKIFEVSPVSELVARTVYWVDPDVIVPVLGAFEVTVGMLLLLGRALRLTLFLSVLQMLGTFLTFFVLPNVTFRRQPVPAHGRGRVRRQEPRADLGGPGSRDDGPPCEGCPPMRSPGLAFRPSI